MVTYHRRLGIGRLLDLRNDYMLHYRSCHPAENRVELEAPDQTYTLKMNEPVPFHLDTLEGTITLKKLEGLDIDLEVEALFLNKTIDQETSEQAQ